jgi:hypothetical protein
MRLAMAAEVEGTGCPTVVAADRPRSGYQDLMAPRRTRSSRPVPGCSVATVYRRSMTKRLPASLRRGMDREASDSRRRCCCCCCCCSWRLFALMAPRPLRAARPRQQRRRRRRYCCCTYCLRVPAATGYHPSAQYVALLAAARAPGPAAPPSHRPSSQVRPQVSRIYI